MTEKVKTNELFPPFWGYVINGSRHILLKVRFILDIKGNFALPQARVLIACSNVGLVLFFPYGYGV